MEKAFQSIALVMLFDMGVIQAIAEEGKQGNVVSRAALAAKLDCDQSLIGESVLYCSVDLEGTSLFRVSAVRLLRLLTAVGYCDEVEPQTYRSNARTEVLLHLGQLAGPRSMMEIQFKTGSELRRYLSAASFHKRATTVTESPCEFAHGKKF